MARVGDVYPSKFLKSEDMIRDGVDYYDLTVTETSVTEFEGGKKQIVLAFQEIDQTLGLNATNAAYMVNASGTDESDGWVGRRVRAKPVPMVRPFQGHTHSIVLSKIPGATKPTPASNPASQLAGQPPATHPAVAARTAAAAVLKKYKTTKEEFAPEWKGAVASLGKPEAVFTVNDWRGIGQMFEEKFGSGTVEGESGPGIPDDQIPFLHNSY